MSKTIKTIRMGIPGKFSHIEESILEHLSSHMSKETAEGLAAVLEYNFQDVRNGIEALIVARLVNYRRASVNDSVTYVNLQLNKEGERQAIIQRQRAKEIVCTVEMHDEEETDR